MKKARRVVVGRLAVACCGCLAVVGLLDRGWRGGRDSCSTFMLAAGGALVVGHNLDESFEVPGQIVVNKRGVAKQNVSWEDLRPGGKSSIPRVRWVSRFGSITYNTVGREFIDGGLNEAGLYVGEMTLLGSKYPRDPALPAFYHHLWMQYLLDNFDSVPQVLESLDEAKPDGHCQWHFFVADRQGRAAVIEFLEGAPVVHTGAGMPVPVLGNLPYRDELSASAEFEGFGGTGKIDFHDRENGRRFVWGAAMIRDFGARPPAEAVPYAFTILRQLDKGSTRWSLVLDLLGARVYWRTDKASEIRHVSFASFDFGCSTPALVLDIHEGSAGDAAGRFVRYSEAANAAAVKAALEQWPMGAMGRTFLKPKMIERMSKVPGSFVCRP